MPVPCPVTFYCPEYGTTTDITTFSICGYSQFAYLLQGWDSWQPVEERCKESTWYWRDCETDWPGCGAWGIAIVYGGYPHPFGCRKWHSCESLVECARELYPDIQIEWHPGADIHDPEIQERYQILCGDSACCFLDVAACQITCHDLRPSECDERDGTFVEGSTCDEIDCRTEFSIQACCFCDEHCQDLPYAVCKSMGGVPTRDLCINYYGSMRCPIPGREPKCASELFGPAQLVLKEGEDPPWPWPTSGYMKYRPDTWQIASRRGLIPFQEQTIPSQHYGKIEARGDNLFSGAVCFNHRDTFDPYGPWPYNELSDCPVVVQTEDDILGDPGIRAGYASFACPIRCPCTVDPC